MSRIDLTGAAYESNSLIAAAQRCLNLYPESIPRDEGEPNLYVHRVSPGLRLLSQGHVGLIRGLYCATNGALYVVSTKTLYLISGTFAWIAIGTLEAGTP